MIDQLTIQSLKTLSLPNMGLKIPVGGGDFIGKTLLIISGEVNGYFFKHTQYGESICLTSGGGFVVVNALSGEVFEGNNLYLPPDYAKTVAQKLDKATAGETLMLTEVEIQIVKSEKAARGYTFVARSMQTLEVQNAKKAYAAKILAAMKQLPAPAPVKAEEKEPSTTAAKSGKNKAA